MLIQIRRTWLKPSNCILLRCLRCLWVCSYCLLGGILFSELLVFPISTFTVSPLGFRFRIAIIVGGVRRMPPRYEGELDNEKYLARVFVFENVAVGLG